MRGGILLTNVRRPATVCWDHSAQPGLGTVCGGAAHRNERAAPGTWLTTVKDRRNSPDAIARIPQFGGAGLVA